jgi:hypothetical protein
MGFDARLPTRGSDAIWGIRAMYVAIPVHTDPDALVWLWRGYTPD